MLLGDLIARFTDQAVAEEAVLALGDLTMLARLREEVDATGLDLGECVVAATRRYAAEASDEEWVTLMGVMGKESDPGAVFLRRALSHVHRQAAAGGCGHGGCA